MGVRILSVDGDGRTCLFDSVTDWAFGPIADEEVLHDFLDFLVPVDPREIHAAELLEKWGEFIALHDAPSDPSKDTTKEQDDGTS